MTHSDKLSQAIKSLHALGAHLVLCRGGNGKHPKAPITPQWQKIKPSVSRVLAHYPNRPLGIVPWSIQTTALDKDDGDASQLIAENPPLVLMLSAIKGHLHLYYSDNEGRGSRKWEAYGCSGDVRGAKGYLLLHDDPWKLLSALENPPPDAVPFPDLFEAIGRPLKTAEVFDPTFSKNPNNRPNPNSPLPLNLELERIYPGGRHSALFDAVRAWAYRQELDRDLDKWRSLVKAYAENQNKRFPVPYGAHPSDGGEVKRMADSVAGWCWSGGGPIDHSPPAQRRRGEKSGRVRRLKVRELDAAAVQAVVVEGRSMRATAREQGRSEKAIRHVIHRDACLFARGQACNTDRNLAIFDAANAGEIQTAISRKFRLSLRQVNAIISELS